MVVLKLGVSDVRDFLLSCRIQVLNDLNSASELTGSESLKLAIFDAYVLAPVTSETMTRCELRL